MSEVIKQWFIKHMPVQEDIGLHENKAFIRWIGYPLLAILVVVIAVTWNLFETGIYSFDKEFEISFVTLNDFAKYYAFPIASLTVPLTFGVMFNRFHSSKQKAKSNLLVEQNNSANNFFNHYKYFAEFCESLSNDFFNKKENIGPEILYKKLFPEASVVHFTTNANEKCIDDIISAFHNTLEEYKNHLLNTELKTVSSLQETAYFQEVETIDVNLLKEPFKFQFKCNGIYYEEFISSPSNFSGTLQRIRNLIFMLLHFNGISNHQLLIDNFLTKFVRLEKNFKTQANIDQF